MASGFQAGSIVGSLVLDKTKWTQSVTGVKTDTKAMGGMSDKMAAGFAKAGKAMTIAGLAIVGIMGSMVKKASDAEETYAKFGTVFKNVIGDAETAASDLADSYGLSTIASKDMLAATGDLLTGLGVSSGAALDLSEKTQQLAVDLASFTNFSGGAKGASEALTKAMLGERESIKSLGIVITEEMVKEKLLADGKKDLTGLAYKQAAAEATLEIAMGQSKNAIGDYERTSGSFANQTRLLKARLEDVAVTLGTKLLPIATQMVTKITEVVKKVAAWTDAHPRLTSTLVKVTTGLGALMLVVGPLLMALPQLISGLKLFKSGLLKLTSPMGLVTIGLTLIIAKAIEARKEFKKSMDLYQKEMEITGEKMGWFEKTWGSVSTAIEKVTTRLDINKISQLGYNATLRAAEPIYAAVTGVTKGLTEAKGFLIDKFKSLNEMIPKTKEEFALLHSGFKNLTTEAYENLSPALKEMYDNLEMKLNPAIKATYELSETAVQNMGILTSSMEDFQLVTISTQEVLDNLRPVMTRVWEEAIPPARDFSSIIDQVPTKLDDVKKTSEETGTAVKSKWEEVADGIRTKWTTNLSEILQGSKSLMDGLKDIFDHIKGMFFDMVAQMVTKWIFDGVKSLVSGAAKAASGIGSSFKGVGKAVAGIGEGIGKLIIGLAKGIAGAAKIIAQAAPQILIAAGVALAIYAGFKVISSLFKKAPKGDDVFKAIKDNTKRIWDVLFKDIRPWGNILWHWLDKITHGVRASIPTKLDITNKHLASIAKSMKQLTGVSAQSGLDMNITRPTMIMTHPGEHARITPAGHTSYGNIALNFNIAAGDGRDMENWLRSKGARMIEDILRQNLGGNAERIESDLARYRRY